MSFTAITTGAYVRGKKYLKNLNLNATKKPVFFAVYV